MTNFEDSFRYREVFVVISHYFGYHYIFEYEDYFYYAYFDTLDNAKQGARKQIDNLLLRKVILDD